MAIASPPAFRLRHLRVTEFCIPLLVLLAGRDERRRLRLILQNRAVRMTPPTAQRQAGQFRNRIVTPQEIAGIVYKPVAPQKAARGVRNLRAACTCARCSRGRSSRRA